MSPDELREPVRRATTAASALPQPLNGRGAYRELVAGDVGAFANLRIENRAAAFAENTVAIEWRITATHAGRTLDIPGHAGPH
jgi:SnoaL-like polyketide cyclase